MNCIAAGSSTTSSSSSRISPRAGASTPADYYAAFVLDPDGNNIEAVFHGPAKKSAESVKITFG